ncbi:hypothetical protein [Phaeobacter sp. JH204B]|uniref:hypothetical protein n=1 Tax=Phaeobacter sp. JH204B TaxID=3112503 RepID=UPI003A86BB52
MTMLEVKKVFVSRLILHDDNPRFEGLLEETRAIEALCKGEKVVELARDIAKNGLSPLERFMVFQEDLEDDPKDANYIVAEGNRRLCALKLLKDPRKAPSQHKAVFKKLAKNYNAPRKIEVVVVEDEDERIKWITRAHAGASNGLGRKQWDTSQKTRYFQNPRNLRGQAVLDYAVERCLIRSDDSENVLSHLVRLLGNPVMRSALGIQFDKDASLVLRDRPLEDFDKLLSWLLEEAKIKKLGSQAKSAPIAAKAKLLEAELGCSAERLEEAIPLWKDLENSSPEPQPESYSPPPDNVASTEATASTDVAETRNSGAATTIPASQPATVDQSAISIKRPIRPQPSKLLQYSEDVYEHLVELKNEKFSSLYYSLSSIPVKDHVPALYVVIWSFLDSLSVALGRHESGNISAHWGKKNLSARKDLGYSKEQVNTVENAVIRVHQHGNETKHNRSAAGFDAAQLSSDWKVILPVIEFDLRKHLKK